MTRPKRAISPSFANGDYCIVWLTVKKNPKIEFLTNSLCPDYQTVNKQTGEIFECKIKASKNPILIKAPFLCDPDGNLVFPALLHMRLLASNTQDKSTLSTHAQALLLFYRWMRKTKQTIYDCFEEKEKGVVYQFRDYLLENVRREKHDPALKEKIIIGHYSASTCTTYILKIVEFYRKMNHQRVVQLSDSFNPFEFQYKLVSRSTNGQTSILSHLNSDKYKIVVETTGLTAPFGRVQSPPSSHTLKPMLEDEKKKFNSVIKLPIGSYFNETNIKNLMLELAVETGLRLEEFVTFPASEVVKTNKNQSEYDVTIGEILNGCITKFDKQRTITINANLMSKLEEYLFSSERAYAIKNSKFRHNCLFVKPQDGLPYSTNTLQKHFELIRIQLRKSYPDWYFTVHDMRATFATHWLYEQHIKRGSLFEVLLDELKELMGHNNSKDTEKYVKYLEDTENWRAFSARKNDFIGKVAG